MGSMFDPDRHALTPHPDTPRRHAVCYATDSPSNAPLRRPVAPRLGGAVPCQTTVWRGERNPATPDVGPALNGHTHLRWGGKMSGVEGDPTVARVSPVARESGV